MVFVLNVEGFLGLMLCCRPASSLGGEQGVLPGAPQLSPEPPARPGPRGFAPAQLSQLSGACAQLPDPAPKSLYFYFFFGFCFVLVFLSLRSGLRFKPTLFFSFSPEVKKPRA